MAQSNEKEENVAITTNDMAQKNAEPVLCSEKTRHCSIMNAITPLIAVTALLVTGYSYYTGAHFNQSLTEENKQLAAELHQLRQQQNGVEQHLSTSANEQQQASNNVEQKIADVQKQMQILSNTKGSQTQDWLLLKARYYLELAQINAHWNATANDQSTTELLQQADMVLKQINTTDLFKIRQIIAKELMALKTANHLDIPGLLSKLDALQNSVSQLNFETTVNPNIGLGTTTEKPQPNEPSWQTHLHASLDILSKLVVIRRNDEEVKPLLSPIYESLLKESIRLNLQEAQWAIINTNPSAYQLALNQALATLKRGFNEHVSNITTLIDEVTKLQKMQLNQERPEIGQALPLLNQLIEQRQIKPEEHNDNREQEL